MATTSITINASTRLDLNYTTTIKGVWNNASNPLRVEVTYSYRFYCPSGSSSMYYNGTVFHMHHNQHVAQCNWYLTAGQYSPSYGPYTISFNITDNDASQAFAPGWGVAGLYTVGGLVHIGASIPNPTVATFASVTAITPTTAILTTSWSHSYGYYYYGFKDTYTNKIYNIGYARTSQEIQLSGLSPNTSYRMQVLIYSPNGVLHSNGSIGAATFVTPKIPDDVAVAQYRHSDVWSTVLNRYKYYSAWRNVEGLYYKKDGYWLNGKGSPVKYKNYVYTNALYNGWYEYIKPITSRMKVELDIYIPSGVVVDKHMPFFGGRTSVEAHDRTVLFLGAFRVGTQGQDFAIASTAIARNKIIRIYYDGWRMFVNGQWMFNVALEANVIPAVNSYFMAINTNGSVDTGNWKWPTGTRIYGARVQDVNGNVLNSFIVDNNGDFRCLLTNTVLPKQGVLTLVKGT